MQPVERSADQGEGLHSAGAPAPNATRGRRPLKILHLLAPAPTGGAEGVILGLATGHRALGHDVRVAVTVDPPGQDHAYVRALGEAGIPCVLIEVSGRGYRAERRMLRDLLTSLRPDVVHTHGYRPDVVSAPVARRLGVPVVSTVHGFTSLGARGRFYEWLQMRALRRLDAVVAVSEPIRERLARARVASPPLRLIVNGWRSSGEPLPREEARRALAVRAEGERVGWIGRLSHEKGADVLLQAMAELEVDCSIVGDGAERARLEGLADSLGVSGRIAWHGEVASAGRLVRAFDVLVISSRSEGTPLVLFEAMEARVPVVATRVGGIPDVIGGGEALLVDSENAHGLAEAVRSCLGDPRGSSARAESAAAVLRDRYGPEPWLEAYLNVYRQVQ